jgi:hypothetical protein
VSEQADAPQQTFEELTAGSTCPEVLNFSLKGFATEGLAKEMAYRHDDGLDVMVAPPRATSIRRRYGWRSCRRAHRHNRRASNRNARDSGGG